MAVSAFKHLSRSFIPGVGGYDTTGNPKQGKVRVIGEFNITTYTAGGEPILRKFLGVETIDTIQFWVKGILPTANSTIIAAWDDTNQKVFIQDVDGVPNEHAAAAIGLVRYEVVGDSILPTETLISDSINP